MRHVLLKITTAKYRFRNNRLPYIGKTILANPTGLETIRKNDSFTTAEKN